MNCPECKEEMHLPPVSAEGEVKVRHHCKPCNLDVIKWRKKEGRCPSISIWYSAHLCDGCKNNTAFGCEEEYCAKQEVEG